MGGGALLTAPAVTYNGKCLCYKLKQHLNTGTNSRRDPSAFNTNRRLLFIDHILLPALCTA